MVSECNRIIKTPVVLFTFKRSDTVLRIIDVLRLSKPQKIYIFSDGPRRDDEVEQIKNARKVIVEAIDWECEIIKVFHEKNVGVFGQIALGAKYVFEKEKRAIFIEDDNLPSPTFLSYCEEMLDKYEHEEKIVWVCGTNYESESAYLDTDYVFTKNMLPCGWASWSEKFLKYYQFDFSLLNSRKNIRRIRKNYEMKSLYRQQMRNYKAEHYREVHNMRYASWDFHMAMSIRYFDLYGIAPRLNQIRNIGVDIYSSHGGTSMSHPNTDKFCEIPVGELSFPLKGPDKIAINKQFEKNTNKIILVPKLIRFLAPFTTLVKKILRIYPDKSLYSLFRK